MLTETRGSYIIAQTPFTDRGEVDLQSIDSLVDFHLKHGADGFVALGVSGEGGKLTPAESLAVVKRFVARAVDKPVIVGVSNASLAQVVSLSEQAMELGASGVMISPPGSLKTDEDLENYFAEVFNRLGDTPVVLQDFPGSSGVWMSVPLISTLVKRHSQIKVIKEEDLPSLQKITRLRESLGNSVAILTGNNGMYLPYEMARGIDGPMAGFSHPEMLSGVYRLFVSGEQQRAHDLFDCYLPLLSYEAQGFWGVAARKEVMRQRGAIRSACMRQPGPSLKPQHLEEISLLIKRQELALKRLGFD